MAVYTKVTERDLQQLDIGKIVSFHGITSGIENTNYLLVTEKAKFILTLFEKRVKEQDLPFYLALMQYLSAKGIPCPAPVGGIKTLCGKPALITTFLEGQSVETPTPPTSLHAGEALATLHRAAEGFMLTRENGMGLAEWKRLLTNCGKLPDVVADELAFQEKNFPRGLPSGAIHADFFPDNVFFTDGKVSGVIDFYFACTGFFAYDLAIAINAWGEGFLEGYERIRPLTKEERAALLILRRAGALRIIATRLYDALHPAPDALVKPKDPAEYIRLLENLREAR